MITFGLSILGKQYIAELPSEDKPLRDVVTRVRYQLSGTEVIGSRTFTIQRSGIADLPPPDPSVFQPIESLTDADLERFVRFVVDVQSLQNEISEEITRRKGEFVQGDASMRPTYDDPRKPPSVY